MDNLTPEQRSKQMGLVRSKNTKPEYTVRKLIHAMGYRYRLHALDLPGKPDLVFRKSKKVIFIHGCFWHKHPDENCRLARIPKSRIDFWGPKLEGNRQRDALNQEKLCLMGWEVLVIWECQIKDLIMLEKRIKLFL